MKSEWDEQIPDNELFRKCNECMAELNKCKDVVVSRSMMPDEAFSEGV